MAVIGNPEPCASMSTRFVTEDIRGLLNGILSALFQEQAHRVGHGIRGVGCVIERLAQQNQCARDLIWISVQEEAAGNGAKPVSTSVLRDCSLSPDDLPLNSRSSEILNLRAYRRGRSRPGDL
jgi:hypothetical protein